MFGLPLLQHFVPAKTSYLEGPESIPGPLVIAALLAMAVLALLWFGAVILGRPAARREAWPPAEVPPVPDDRETILVDGSNVIYWQDNTPQLAPLLQVVRDLSRRGMKPGIVFDANVGYKLMGRFMGERDLSQLLSVPPDQILVVPKGTQADPFLLETARDLKARIVTNDRYRDWIDRYPDVAHPDMLVTGEMRDGKVSLRGLEAKEDAH